MVGGGWCLLQMGSCTVDPDIILRAGLAAGSDFSIFLLENLVRAF